MKIRDLAIYFGGYLDAASKQYSTNETLIALTCRAIDDQISIAQIIGSNEYELLDLENNKHSFQEEVSTFLDTDPKERLLFYLIDYFSWFEHFSETYSIKKLSLLATEAPAKYIGYLLTCNKNINIFVYIYEKQKN